MVEELRIIKQIHNLSAILSRSQDKLLLERFGIGLSQYKILYTLLSLERSSQKYISTMIGQTEASISRQIKILIAQDMLISSINVDNKREHLVRLSPKGLRFVTEIEKVIIDKTQLLFASFSPKETTQLLNSLNKLNTPTKPKTKP
jgi:DNA-binding MarR family transcriptional regulator